jgi:DNA-binding NtrC family response regulator
MIEFKILIVERDENVRHTMYKTLRDSFTTQAVESGHEALEKIKQEKPDLVLIDFQIADMSSIELQQEISKTNPDIHVAMISNIDRSKISLESMKRRAMDYIYRSDDTERFINDVCKLVRYIIDVKYKVPKEKEIISSGFYDLAKKLYEEKKWTVEDIHKMLEERDK